MAFITSQAVLAKAIQATSVSASAIGDPYAVDGFEPELAFDFTGETYRTDGSATTFSGAMTHSATSLGTMVDGYGPELVKNGTFDTDLRNWTDYSEAGGSIAWNASGIALTTGVDGTQEGRAYQIITTEVGKVYQVTATRSGAASRFDISSSGPASADLYISSTSTTDISTFIVATSTTTYLNLRNLTSYNDTAYIDNISVREVPAIKWRPHNLLTYSEDFSNASWSKTNSTISSNVTTSPSGTLSADKIIPANLATNGNTAKSVSVSAATYTLSFYAKADDQSVVSFVSNMSGTFRANIFNLSTGVATQATDWEAKMIDVGNGWWRCIATAVAASASSYTFQIGNNSTGWTGDGTSGVYIWGAHLYRSDLGGMVDNPDRGDSYVPTAVRVLPSAPELVTNGHFNSGIDGWTDGNAEGTIAWNASGYMDLARNSGSGGGIATQSITTTSGKYYLVTFDIISLSHGIKVYFGTPGSDTFTTTGSKTFIAAADASSETLRFDLLNSATATATIDNVSVKESYIDPSVARYLPRRGHYVYNGQEWTNRGLLLESEARTNLVTYSEDFTNVAWAATSSTVTLDVTGPDGQANSAATLLPSSGSAYHFVRYSTGSISTTYTLSVFAKANGYDFLIIGDNLASGAGNQRIAFFDLSNGSVGTIDDNSTGNVLSTTIEDVGNGWYRCSVTYVASSALHDIGVSDSDGASSFTANGTSSILIYGAQLEAGSTPSSYMPTNGATFTRAVETLTVAAADLPSTISPSGSKAALVTAGWTITDGGAV